jgi:hypothetical protein
LPIKAPHVGDWVRCIDQDGCEYKAQITGECSTS